MLEKRSVGSNIRKWWIGSKLVSHGFTFFVSYSACWIWFHHVYSLWRHETDIRLALITVTDNRDKEGGTGVQILTVRLWGLNQNQFCILARSPAYWTHRLTLLKMAATTKPNSDLWHLAICWLLEEKFSRIGRKKSSVMFILARKPFVQIKGSNRNLIQ